MADMAAREGESSARRRRDRQLRAMELATALHHSAQGPKKRVVEEPREEELPVKHNATSGQNATPPWGLRPAHPFDVSEQPLVAATCVAAGVPLHRWRLTRRSLMPSGRLGRRGVASAPLPLV